jgi:hypothetical protein
MEGGLAQSLERERISALVSTSFGVGRLLLTALRLAQPGSKISRDHAGLPDGAESRST